MIHHGNQEIQKNYDVDDGISAEHKHAPESSEDLDSI